MDKFEVRAKKRGFFGGVYRTPNKSKPFDVTEDEFSDIWMEKTSDVKKEAVKKEEGEDSEKGEDIVRESLEIPSLMPEFKKPAKKKAAKKSKSSE